MKIQIIMMVIFSLLFIGCDDGSVSKPSKPKVKMLANATAFICKNEVGEYLVPNPERSRRASRYIALAYTNDDYYIVVSKRRADFMAFKLEDCKSAKIE